MTESGIPETSSSSGEKLGREKDGTRMPGILLSNLDCYVPSLYCWDIYLSVCSLSNLLGTMLVRGIKWK